MRNQHPPVPSAHILRPILTSLVNHRFTIPMIIEDLAATHGITISIRTVKRRLKELDLSIRCRLSLLEQRQLVLEEMSISNGSKGVGLQTIQNRIYHKHNVIIGTQRIRETMLEEDRLGLQLRDPGIRIRVRRVPMTGIGPYAQIGCDGHDKLLRWGVRIYAYVDNWSRSVLSMKIARTRFFLIIDISVLTFAALRRSWI